MESSLVLDRQAPRTAGHCKRLQFASAATGGRRIDTHKLIGTRRDCAMLAVDTGIGRNAKSVCCAWLTKDGGHHAKR